MMVELSQTEWYHAVQTGALRMLVSLRNQITDIAPDERDWLERIGIDILGAAGELAVAKALNVFHDGTVNTFHRVADCSADVEVRTTTRKDGCLIVRPNDADDRRFVLVIARPPQFYIAGWMLGRYAKRNEFIKNPHGHRQAWFVPRAALLPWSEWKDGE